MIKISEQILFVFVLILEKNSSQRPRDLLIFWTLIFLWLRQSTWHTGGAWCHAWLLVSSSTYRRRWPQLEEQGRWCVWETQTKSRKGLGKNCWRPRGRRSKLTGTCIPWLAPAVSTSVQWKIQAINSRFPGTSRGASVSRTGQEGHWILARMASLKLLGLSSCAGRRLSRDDHKHNFPVGNRIFHWSPGLYTVFRDVARWGWEMKRKTVLYKNCGLRVYQPDILLLLVVELVSPIFMNYRATVWMSLLLIRKA